MRFLACFDWKKYDEARKAAHGASAQAEHLSRVAHSTGTAEAHLAAQHGHRDAKQAHANARREASLVGHAAGEAEHGAALQNHQVQMYEHQGHRRVAEGKPRYVSAEQEQNIRSIGKSLDTYALTQKAMKQLGESPHFRSQAAGRNPAQEWLDAGFKNKK